MMKRYLLSIIFGFLAFTNFSFGQLEINFASESANTSGTVDIDVTTNGFTDISVLQFSAGWDSLVMKFNSVVYTNPALSDLAPNNISGSEGASNVDPGQFTFSYGSPTGDGNLDDGEIIFTVRFDILGDECDETTIELTGDPLSIEAFDANFNELTVSSQPGEIMINGSDCGGSGGDELSITASTLTADVGGTVCVPLTVENFIGVQAGSGTIFWDPDVVSYTGLANIDIGEAGLGLNDTNTDNGELKFVWSNPDPANPLEIADGGVIFDICFDVVGSVGEMTPITLSTEGSLGFEWTDDNDDVIPQVLTNGKVTITEEVADPFTLIVSEVTTMQGSNGCVDVSVENFDDILSMQFVITWDASILSNPTPSNFNLPSLNASNFNIDGNCATFTWNGSVGLDLADGTTIFSLCFDATGACDSSSEIDLVSKGSTNIEIIDGATNEISGVSVNAGSMTVGCGGPDCNVVSIDKSCAGELSGNITVDVPTDNCTYSWTNSSGTEVSTDRNLLGVAAGTYTLTVSCDGSEVCAIENVEIENHPDMNIIGNVTNAGCGDLGAIAVSVSNGSGNYSYNWNPAQGDTPNISGLEPATYQLTVTDADRGCTKTAEFSVVNEVADMEITTSLVTDESCIGNDGRISLTVEGGCQPYTYAWSDGGDTPILTNLTAGNYQVTVSDDSTPANTVTGSFTVDGVDPLALDGTPIITPSTGADGAITIQITGGTPDYTYNWSGPTSGLPNSNTITGLMDGNYTVTVTDSQGCSETYGPFNVPLIEDGEEPVITNVTADNNENGFAILCNGDVTGSITGFLSQGELPITVELSGTESRMFTVESLGTIVIEDLAAGTYTITVSNSFAVVSVENIVLEEPEDLATSIETGCDSEEQCDGFIDLNVTGGFGDLTYAWGDTSLEGESLDGLCKGNYSVLVTDEHDCKIMETIVIESCEGPVDPDCYQVRDVITPNGDGMNDQFSITCISDFPASLEVYDRWGKLVYNQNSYDGSWMGISNSNEELIEGGYMYIINIDFGSGRREIMKGTLTLLRD